MEEVKMYRCSICKHCYDNRESAMECEKIHKKIIKYEPRYNDRLFLSSAGKYPRIINVIFEDDEYEYVRKDLIHHE